MNRILITSGIFFSPFYLMAQGTSSFVSILGLVGLVASILLLLAYLSATKKEKLAREKIRELEIKIAKNREENEIQAKSKNRLFAIVSHDIKSPLGFLTGFTDLLLNYVATKQTEPDEELDRIKGYLTDGKERILHLLDDLVFWVQTERGTIPFRPSDLKLSAVIKEGISSQEPLAKAKNIHLSVDQPDEELVIHGDRNTIKAIIKNVVNNAVKFTAEGGEVSIRVHTDADMAHISVKDNGLGMSKDQLAKAFDNSKDKVQPGTKGEKGIGMGLFVAQTLVLKNEGKIVASSTEGEGTIFTISLPLPVPSAD